MTNRFKGWDLVDRMAEELWMEVCNTVQEAVTKTIPKEKNNARRSGCLRRLYSSVQFSRSVMFDSLRPHGLHLTSLPCPLPTPGACSNSCPSSWWCHPTISSSVVPFSTCLQSFPAWRSFLRSQFFPSGGQSIRVSASKSVLLMNIHNWFSLGLTGWISLLSKGLPRVFSNTTVQKHQFFSAQLSLWSNSRIHTCLLEKL